ncbi:MAG: hybrid sensor histidine kinase/response regulator, partial [Candidatus Omnitrophota bacterium]
PEMPLIVVSGTIGEDVAVEMMKSGAADYVMKDKIFKLAPAVKRALKECEEFAERKKAEIEMQKRLNELEIFYKASMSREERILELKKEIEQLKKAIGERGT